MTLLLLAKRALENAGSESPLLDAELLLAHVLGQPRHTLKMQPDIVLSPVQQAQFEALLERRKNREPMAYILGEKDFWKHRFYVSPAVLCPRPDTEVLVEAAIATQPTEILDLGTGSGAILLSILGDCPAAFGLGVDISPQALEIAQKNAQHLGLASRTRFLLGSWCEGLSHQDQFDLIVSNPPYIATEVLQGLSPEVSVFEPKTALDGGINGLDAYQKLVPQLPLHLRPGGWVILEVGEAQAPAVAQLLSEQNLRNIHTKKDYQGIERCVLAQC